MSRVKLIAPVAVLLAAFLAPAATAVAASGPTVGDTITLSGENDGEQLAVTLTKLSDPAQPADQYNDPSAGDRLVGVQIRIANDGTVPYSDAPENDVAIVDSQGQSYDSSLDDISAGPAFPGTVDIPVGDSRLGYVVFEVPQSVQITEFQFTPDSGYADDVGTWSVPAHSAPVTVPPGTVVTEFYDAINAQDYQTAWDLGGKNLGHSYSTFVAGFADTEQDSITIGTTDGDVVHVRLDADMTDGSTQHWAGTYTVRNGVIVSGHLVRQ